MRTDGWTYMTSVIVAGRMRFVIVLSLLLILQSFDVKP